MSNNYVKKYDVGQIKLDLPYANYIHELPLLSFGDVLHTINLGIVFNKKMRQKGKNNSFIAPGYRINLHKCINFENNRPESFQDESGKCICLINNNNIYTFKDDSKRVMRISGDGYEIEYPDFSKEHYSSDGNITFLFNKYGEKILEYSYNSSDQLASITYRSSKTVNFIYETNKLKNISYAGKHINISYTNFEDGTHIKISHYSSVDYYLKSTENNYEAYSAHKYSGYMNGCCEKWICTNNSNTLTVNKMLGLETVDTNTYEFLNISTDTGECSLIDVIDKNDVLTRIQLINRKIAYSYELTENLLQGIYDVKFNYDGTVFSYDNNEVIGSQSQNEGMKMRAVYDNCWEYSMNEAERASGYFILSGWMNVAANTECTFKVTKANIPEEEYSFVYTVPVIQDQTWQYFSFRFKANNVGELIVTHNIAHLPSVVLRDLRLTFQAGIVLGPTYANHLAVIEDVFIIENNQGEDTKILPAQECSFYIDGSSINGTITAADILKYKINQMYGNHKNVIYYNNCKDVIANINTFNVQYKENAAIETVSVSNIAVGKRIYKDGKEYITKTNFYADGNFTHLMTKSSVDGVYYKEDVYDEHLDLIRSTVDGITTTYVRNNKGLVESQEISAEGISETITSSASYDENCTKLLSTTDEFGVTTTYTTDDTWGLLERTSINGNTIITNEYDLNKLALIKHSFANGDGARKNTFEYIDGKLGSMTHGGLNYTFGYTDKGELARVRKNGDEIETYSYSEDEDGSTANIYYNSHSVLQEFDKHGRLKEIEDVLRNTYDVLPTYNSSEGYKMSGNDSITGKLAITQDFIANQTTKYAYEGNSLSRVGTISGENIVKEETFEYDAANRVTKDRLVYNGNNPKVFESVILYDEEATDPTADGRVKRYSCYLNGATSPIAQTGTYYDDFNRVTTKFCSIGGKEFKKSITYNKTRPRQLLEMIDGRPISNINYEYDAMGRIKKFNNTEYTYDEYGQLTKEQTLDKTTEYEYNGIGNIVSVTKNGAITMFGYDTTNPDRLTSYKNKAITYNANGGVSSYDGYNYAWNKGKLASISKGNFATGLTNYSFNYNGLGQRISKSYMHNIPPLGSAAVEMGMLTSCNQSFNYDHSGRLISETVSKTFYGEGTSYTELVYLYDESGIVGVQYTNGVNSNAYYFLRNLQGDVIAIYDTNGVEVVSYSYDAWGNCTINSSTTNYDLAHDNPIRYRGYYYDEDTKLYYLNSRYYSPEFRRFISPDDTAYLDPESVNGLNLYCYCGNDPINYCDPSGNSAILATLFVGFIVGATVGGVYGGLTAVANEQNVWAGIGIGALAGGVMGLGTAAASMFLAPIIVGQTVVVGSNTFGTGAALAIGTGIAFGTGAAGGAGGDILTQLINDGAVHDWQSVAWSGIQWGLINTASAFLGSLAGPIPDLYSALLSAVFGSETSVIGLLIDTLRNRKSQKKNVVPVNAYTYDY